MNALNPVFYKEKIFSAAWFRTYGLLVIGSFVLAMGYTFFMTPYKIVPGGIYGIATILHYKLGFPIGMAALCFNLPLSLWGVKVLGCLLYTSIHAVLYNRNYIVCSIIACIFLFQLEKNIPVKVVKAEIGGNDQEG